MLLKSPNLLADTPEHWNEDFLPGLLTVQTFVPWVELELLDCISFNIPRCVRSYSGPSKYRYAPKWIDISEYIFTVHLSL